MTNTLLDSTHSQITLLCFTDPIAINFYSACRSRKMKTGRGISIIGCGNSDLAQYACPGLTSIEHCPYANGFELRQALLNMINVETPKDFALLQPVELIIRESGEPPR